MRVRDRRRWTAVLLLSEVLATALVGGCGNPFADPDAGTAVAALAGVAAPAAGWTDDVRDGAEGEGLDVVDEVQRGSRTVAVVADPDAVDDSAPRHYAVAWGVRVRPGQERQRCAEAADWIVDTRRLLPGEAADGDQSLDVEQVAHQCVVAFPTRVADGAGSVTLGGQANTHHAGFQYGPFLELRYGDRLPLLRAEVWAVEEP